ATPAPGPRGVSRVGGGDTESSGRHRGRLDRSPRGGSTPARRTGRSPGGGRHRGNGSRPDRGGLRHGPERRGTGTGRSGIVETEPERHEMKEFRDRVHAAVEAVIRGQTATVDALLIAALVGGHVLLEGVPGTAKTLLAGAMAKALGGAFARAQCPPAPAKTLLARAMAKALGVAFARAQFTPDMLPSDLTGTMTLRQGELSFRPGPVFTNLLLADEINRTPPKTQAALLEAMEERQVTV